MQQQTTDVLILGAGAGGLSTAISAKKHGSEVIILEKTAYFGGTMAFSGGVLWIPANQITKTEQSTGEAKRYLKNELGNFYNEAAVNTFLDNGAKMVEFFEKETEVKFIPTLYPDYHPQVEGGVDVGRSILAAPYNTTALGGELKRLRSPLSTITFIGMMFNSSNADLKHFFNATKSLKSFIYVAKRLAAHSKDMLLYQKGVNVTSGNALAARLAKTVFDLKIPLYTNTTVTELIKENGRVIGVKTNDKIYYARHVVLACGGFPHDGERLKSAYPHVKKGGVHHSPTPKDNTGDGVALAETAGGECDIRYPNAAAWMPVSIVPDKGVFPHLLDRYKPGVIMVSPKGKRFCNESESYHDVGAAMIKACEGETYAYMIADSNFVKKYGLGYAKPAPVPTQIYVANGYLNKGNTLEELAKQIAIDEATLKTTVENYNKEAVNGNDPEFNRGETSFNRYLADNSHQPNPCVAPILKAPFYALKIYMGDLGTFDGLSTDAIGRVLTKQGEIIDGLYAVGNDRASVMGGNYPAAGITLGPILTYGYVLGKFLNNKH